MNVWMLVFEGDCADCNGVYSSKEKAREALLFNYERCKNIWKDFRQEVSDEWWETWSFEIEGHGRFGVFIEEHELDVY